MMHYVWADTIAEAEAIIEYLQNRYDNHSGHINRHDLLVSWRWDEFDSNDWQNIYESTLEKLEGTPEYDELLEQGCL